MNPHGHWKIQENFFLALDDNDDWMDEEEDEDEDYEWESFATTIADAKYEKMTTEEIVLKLTHLNSVQRAKLKEVLDRRSTLFDGTLGHPHKKIHLELEANATPVHAKPYSIPKVHEEVFKKELAHLVAIGVLQPCEPTEWASPTFIIPKKDGRI